MKLSFDVQSADREMKLFIIRGLKQDSGGAGEQILLKLITDNDPVVRGKTALAMRTCSDQTLVTAAQKLLDKEDPNQTILGLELLMFTQDYNYTEILEELLNDPDPRVIKSVIASLENLPEENALCLLDEIIQDYDPDLNKALTRFFIRTNNPEYFPILKKWFEQTDADSDRKNILRITAGLPVSEAKAWVKKRLPKVGGVKTDFIRWMLRTL